jgi:hypothetical protein
MEICYAGCKVEILEHGSWAPKDLKKFIDALKNN